MNNSSFSSSLYISLFSLLVYLLLLSANTIEGSEVTDAILPPKNVKITDTMKGKNTSLFCCRMIWVLPCLPPPPPRQRVSCSQGAPLIFAYSKLSEKQRNFFRFEAKKIYSISETGAPRVGRLYSLKAKLSEKQGILFLFEAKK